MKSTRPYLRTPAKTGVLYVPSGSITPFLNFAFIVFDIIIHLSNAIIIAYSSERFNFL